MHKKGHSSTYSQLSELSCPNWVGMVPSSGFEPRSLILYWPKFPPKIQDNKRGEGGAYRVVSIVSCPSSVGTVPLMREFVSRSLITVARKKKKKKVSIEMHS